jgi:hypothetical protein
MALRRALQSSVAAICIASLAAPAAPETIPAPKAASQKAAPQKAAPAQTPAKTPARKAADRPRAGGPFEIKVAQARDFSRVEFHGVGQPAAKREGQTLTLTFGRDGDPDISRLRVSPPKWVQGAEARHVGGRLQLVLKLAPDAEFKLGAADGAAYLNVFARPEAEPAEAKTAEAETSAAAPAPVVQRANPVPAGGVVHMDAKLVNGQVKLSFPWANPNGAAVFKRGDAVWLVFDASAELDVSKAPRGLRQFKSMQSFRGTDYSAVRIAGAGKGPVVAEVNGPTWTITLGEGADVRPSLIRLSRDEAGGPAALKAAVSGVTGVVLVDDPAVGDTMTVVTALGPAKGLPTRREFVQMAFLPSMQGLALESYVEDMTVSYDGDLVHVGRPQGLALSPSSSGRQDAQASLGSLKPAAMPALIGADWGKTGAGGFLPRYNALLAAATDESANHGDDAPTEARMSLARFLVGSPGPTLSFWTTPSSGACAA